MVIDSPGRDEVWSTNPARTINFDAFYTYARLVTIAEPDPSMYSFLRSAGVDLDHCINLLGGAIALCDGASSGRRRSASPFLSWTRIGSRQLTS
jgi:hypothetical protein